MKWFFALNEGGPTFGYYAGLVQVAVHTARQYTNLEPVFIYDGRDNLLTDWLLARGVVVLKRRSIIAGDILRTGSAASQAIASGAYLRVEVPLLMQEMGWSDPFALYTDCDVMFTPRFDETALKCTPRFFAVAPEDTPGNLEAMNSGVMVMNVEALRSDWPAFQATIRAELAASFGSSFDQHAYRVHYQGRWEHLPAELNWKPHWGRNDAAQIIHFHGPKPFQKYSVTAGQVPPVLLRLATDSFYEYAVEFDQALLSAQRSTRPGTEPGDWFSGVEVEGGLLPLEGPHPAEQLPKVRWGVAPSIRLRLKSGLGPGRRTLRLAMLSQETGQEIAVRLDGQEVRNHVFRAANVFEEIQIELNQAGPDTRVELVPRKWRNDPDGHARAVLFRALWVEETQSRG